MPSESSHRRFLGNDLAAGRCRVEGHPVALQHLRVPIVVGGTERDHIAPWPSVNQIHDLADTEVGLALTKGGTTRASSASLVTRSGLTGWRRRRSTPPARAACSGRPPQRGARGQGGRRRQRWLARNSSARRVAARVPGAPSVHALQR
jgi:polyhydroxyalkanoate synthase subunit PhaC